jgi:hypothetical protein
VVDKKDVSHRKLPNRRRGLRKNNDMSEEEWQDEYADKELSLQASRREGHIDSSWF